MEQKEKMKDGFYLLLMMAALGRMTGYPIKKTFP
jgi:hypothetical protein